MQNLFSDFFTYPSDDDLKFLAQSDAGYFNEPAEYSEWADRVVEQMRKSYAEAVKSGNLPEVF